MTWFKVDDKLWAHPKWLSLPATARALWVTAGSYCASYETDGCLNPANILPLGGRKRDAERLVEAGLWEHSNGGYRFHNWEEFQPTKAQLEAERSQAKERMKALREKRRSGDVRPNNDRTSPEVRLPRPDPTRPDHNKPPIVPQTGDTKKEFDTFWKTFPSERKRDKKTCAELFRKAIKNGTTPEEIITGAKNYRDDPNREPQYTVNPVTWLRQQRWESGPLPGPNRNDINDYLTAGQQLLQEKNTQCNNQKWIESPPPPPF